MKTENKQTEHDVPQSRSTAGLGDCHAELLEIHKIIMCIAECPPIKITDSYTVRGVKEMAFRITNSLEYLEMLNRHLSAPVGKKLTDREKVLLEYPDAWCDEEYTTATGYTPYEVFSARNKKIGSGKTERQAWADAAKKLTPNMDVSRPR